jgi:hypothetical protein
VYCTVDRVVLCLNEESLPHPMEMTELAREHIAATRAGYGAWYLSRIVSCATPNRDATDAIAGISRRNLLYLLHAGWWRWPFMASTTFGGSGWFVAAQQHEQQTNEQHKTTN